MTHPHIARTGLAGLLLVTMSAGAAGAQAQTHDSPSIPPIGVRNEKYLDVPASARGPATDPAKGYRLQDLGRGLHMITDNAIQSLFLVYDGGVVVIDAPQAFGARIPAAIAEVTSNPITHLIYSHEVDGY